MRAMWTVARFIVYRDLFILQGFDLGPALIDDPGCTLLSKPDLSACFFSLSFTSESSDHLTWSGVNRVASELKNSSARRCLRSWVWHLHCVLSTPFWIVNKRTAGSPSQISSAYVICVEDQGIFFGFDGKSRTSEMFAGLCRTLGHSHLDQLGTITASKWSRCCRQTQENHQFIIDVLTWPLIFH